LRGSASPIAGHALHRFRFRRARLAENFLNFTHAVCEIIFAHVIKRSIDRRETSRMIQQRVKAAV
jgi:hypothetical protein